jgi:hypothetical protein
MFTVLVAPVDWVICFGLGATREASMATEHGVFPKQTITRILAGEEKAQKAFAKLIKELVNEDQLILDLCNIIQSPPFACASYLHGQQPKTAKRFPKRIENFAQEIESVNTSSLHYELLLSHFRRDAKTGGTQPWVLDDNYRKTLEIFEGLPSILRAYAQFVEFAMRQKKRRPSAQAALVINLIDHVKRATGRAHYPEIEALLDAVFRNQGQWSPYDQRKLQDLYRKTRRYITPLALSPNDLE